MIKQRIWQQLSILLAALIISCHVYCQSDDDFASAEPNNPISLVMKILDVTKSECDENSCIEYPNISNHTRTDNPNESPSIKPASCADILKLGHKTSGIYKVYPKWKKNWKPFDVYCDQETDGGGWTVFQRRDDFEGSQEDFFRNWTDYKTGFGKLTKEFWLGNDLISLLTTEDRMELRVDLEDFENNHRYATYTNFLVLDEKNSYLMTYSEYEGDAGNGLQNHNGMGFSTKDRDNKDECANSFKGGWWYHSCHFSNLNGIYLRGHHDTLAIGVNWEPFKGYNYSLKKTEMKLRPQYYKEEE